MRKQIGADNLLSSRRLLPFGRPEPSVQVTLLNKTGPNAIHANENLSVSLDSFQAIQQPTRLTGSGAPGTVSFEPRTVSCERGLVTELS